MYRLKLHKSKSAVPIATCKHSSNNIVFIDKQQDSKESCNEHVFAEGQIGIILPYLTKRDGRTSVHIYGMAGSGKTTKAIEYANCLRDIFPQLRIIVINGKEDETKFEINEMVELPISALVEPDQSEMMYKKAKIEYNINKKNMTSDERMARECLLLEIKPNKNACKWQVTEVVGELMKDSVFIFDDIEGPLYEQALFLGQWLCQKGRSKNCNVLFVTHQVSDYGKTRALHSEFKQYIMFSNSPKRNREYLLKTYCKLSARQIKRINKMLTECDWVAVDHIREYAQNERRVILL